MAQNKKNTAYEVVSDDLYSVLYAMRYSNNNCHAIIVTNNKSQESVNVLQYDNGIKYICVVPKSLEDKFIAAVS